MLEIFTKFDPIGLESFASCAEHHSAIGAFSNARHLDEVEVNCSHDLRRRRVGCFETIKQKIVADAMRLCVDRVVGEIVARLISANLDRTNVMRPTAAVHVFFLCEIESCKWLGVIVVLTTHRSEIVEIFCDVTRSTPFGAGKNSAEQWERIARQQSTIVLIFISGWRWPISLQAFLLSQLTVSVIQSSKAVSFPCWWVTIFIDLTALLHELQHVAKVDFKRSVDPRQLSKQNSAFIVVAASESWSSC